MERKLEILLLEDTVNDAKQVERVLRSNGIDFSMRRVDTRDDFLRALKEQRPDLILTDYKVPNFGGLSALKLARELLPHTPTIVVTGTMDDERAVELLREGAVDYILKDRLSRLAPAVTRALAEADEARRSAAMELALKNSELRYRRLFESAHNGVLILEGGSGTIIDVNPYLYDLLGYTSEEMLGKNAAEIGAVKDIELATTAFKELQKNDYIRYEHLPLKSKTGQLIDVEIVSNAYLVENVRYIQCDVRDIRERVVAERQLNEQLKDLRQFQKLTVDRELRMQELEQEVARIKKKGG